MSNCIIWGTQASVTSAGERTLVRSERTAGSYVIGGTAEAIKSRDDRLFCAKLTTWLIGRRLAGEEAPFISSETLKQVRAQSQLSTSARLDRFWQYLAHINYSVGDRLYYGSERSGPTTVAHLNAWMECYEDTQFGAFLEILREEGFLTFENGRIRLSARGWARLEATQRGGINSRYGFAAMWFSEATDRAFAEGIEPAIRRAGYEPIRIDRVEHNRKIDDEIIANIKQSRFIVADFTCGTVSDGEQHHTLPRGGVYFEAGYAMGLGIQVIWSCREDQIGSVHFDTNHFAHILWNTPEELEERLYNRIAAVVGLGPSAV